MLLEIPVRQFRFRSGDGRLVPGFVAEEVAQVYPVAAALDLDGAPIDWDVRYLMPGLLALVQDQHRRITALEGSG